MPSGIDRLYKVSVVIVVLSGVLNGVKKCSNLGFLLVMALH